MDQRTLRARPAEDPIQCSSNDQLPLADAGSSINSQSQPAGPIHDTITQVPLGDAGHSAEAGQVVKTQVGRVTKKVNRLIESMVQRPFGFRDFASSVSKRSQCLLTLF